MSLLLVVLRVLMGGPVMATQFGAHDEHNPNAHLACWKELGRKYSATLDDDRDLVVAHRTLPCGTTVVVCNPRTLRCTQARVGDRGPFGHVSNGPRKGEFRAQVDLATAVARRIKFNGYEKVWMTAVQEGELDSLLVAKR